MKIFIGLTDIANISHTYARAFQALGHETVTLVWERNRFYPDAQYDFVVEAQPQTVKPAPGSVSKKLRSLRTRIAAWRYFPAILRQCDIFIYLFGSSFFPNHLDYRLIRKSGKKLVSTFWGSDIRYAYALEQESTRLGFAEEIRPFLDYLKTQPGGYHKRLRKVRAAERYADLILSQQGYGQLQTRPYMRANVPIDLSNFAYQVPGREHPLIVHAPSKRDIKGTSVVLAVIDQLRQQGLTFDFRLIENMPNSAVRTLLTESDIVIDELYSETVGMLSTEGMATGNVVLSRYMNEYGHVPAECPVVNVNVDTLKPVLHSMIVNRSQRIELARAGRPFVEKYYAHTHVAQEILDWLAQDPIEQYDYLPTFYKDFKVPGRLLIHEYRQGLQFWK